MPLAPLTLTSLAQIGLSDDALDGPFVGSGGSFGLLVSLRGSDGGSLPTPAQLRWQRDVPAAMRTGSVALFVRRGDNALFLGEMRFTAHGQVARDGFKALFTLEVPLDDDTWRALVTQANAPPPPAAEEAISALSPSASTDERLSAMRMFIARWYGDVDAAEAALPASMDLPRPLRVLHESLRGKNVCAQNRLVSPAELTHEDDGSVVFFVENQGVSSWAARSVGAPVDDPPVDVRSQDWPRAWQRETDTLSEFLIELLLLEATYGAPYGASHDSLDKRALARLTKQLPELPLPRWATSGVRFLGAGGVIAFASRDDDRFTVRIGAKDRVRLEPLASLVARWPDVRF